MSQITFNGLQNIPFHGFSYVNLLITEQKNASSRAATVRALAAVPENEKETVAFYVSQLMGNQSGDYDLSLCISLILVIPVDQRAEIIHDVLQLIAPQDPVFHRLGILDILAKVDPGERAEVIQFVLNLIDQGQDTTSVGYILEALLNIAVNQRAEIVQIVLKLNAEDPVKMIEGLAEVPRNERGQIVDLAVELINPQMNDFGKIDMIRELVLVPPDERVGIVQLILNANMLKPNGMIELLTKIPADERAQILDLGLQLITPLMGGFERNEIMTRLASLPADERAEIVHHALQVINPQMRGADRAEIIRNLSNIDRGERANYVEQIRQGQQAYLFQNAQVLAEHGLNVHANDRDERVRAAMELFQQHQGEVPRDRINQSVEEFIQYLNDQQMDPQDKQLAERALLAPKDEDEVFGAFISEGTFTLLGLETSGKEVVGRLWIFASELAEPDRTNAKAGMISALKNSYDHMATRVCDQGKTQRLLIAVLQGRLPGVNIELIEEMQVPIAQAIQMFFSIEAHQHIQQLQPLLEAARRFCDQNPLINQADFFREIRQYAQNSGFGD